MGRGGSVRPDSVFVYGNLMRGFPRHHVLGNNPLFVGSAETKGEFHFLLLDGLGPILMKGGSTSVKGEVYSNVDFGAIDADLPQWVDRCPISVSLKDVHGKSFSLSTDTVILVDSKKAIKAPGIISGDWRRHLAGEVVSGGGITEAWRYKGTTKGLPHGVYIRSL